MQDRERKPNVEIWNQILEQEPYLKELQESFHRHPELSGEEDWLCEQVCAFLRAEGIPCRNVPRGGVLGFLQGRSGGKTVLLRADLDALPLTESPVNGKGPKRCVSEIPGACHACGHDAHTAMLLIAARILARNRDAFPGQIVFMFERGEEFTTNCTRLFRELETLGIPVESAFGVHIYAGLDSGKVAVNDGPVMASNLCFNVEITGRGGHGSRPDQARSPIDCFVAVHQALSQLRLGRISPYHPMTWSIGEVKSGSQDNIIPETLDFSGTARFFDVEDGNLFRDGLTEILDSVTRLHGCTYRYRLLRAPCLPVINRPECAELEREALGRMIGAEALCRCDPWMSSEPFSRSLAMWPGVFALVGTRNEALGTGAPHHSAEFEVDPAVLKQGTAASVSYALGFLNSALALPKPWKSFADLYESMGLPEDQIGYLRGLRADYDSI